MANVDWICQWQSRWLYRQRRLCVDCVGRNTEAYWLIADDDDVKRLHRWSFSIMHPSTHVSRGMFTGYPYSRPGNDGRWTASRLGGDDAAGREPPASTAPSFRSLAHPTPHHIASLQSLKLNETKFHLSPPGCYA